MDNKKVTLTELMAKKEEPTKLVEAKIEDLKPARVEENPTKDFMKNELDLIDTAINRIADESIKYEEKVKEEKAQIELEKEISSEEDELEKEVEFGDTDEEPTKVISIHEKEVSSLELDPEDFEDLDEEDEEMKEDDTEKQIKVIKNKIKEKLKPVTKAVDLTSFSISKKPMTVSNALKATEHKETVDWVLPAAGRSLSMEEFKGMEIEKLNPANSGRNALNTYKEIFQLLYSHTVDANKPDSMEKWVKLLKFADLNHIYFAVYMSSFKDANYIPYSCPHCKEVFVTENIAMSDMIKYKNDDIKKKMEELKNSDTTSESVEFEIELIQISDEYVVGLKEASVYNMIFENIMIGEDFSKKYSQILALAVYMDSIYFIDRETNELRPIEYTEYPNNIIKTIKSKIVTFTKVLKTLNSDQFKEFNAYIDAIAEKHDEISYVLPSVTCVKCNKEIDETEMSADSLLFTRHQLADIANT